MKLYRNIGFSLIEDYETYYKAKAIINNYITYVKQVNGDQEIETGKIEETEDEIRVQLKEQGINAIKKLLDQQYIDEMDIDDEEIETKQEQYKKNSDTYNLNIEEIFESNLAENIKLVLVSAKLNNKDLQMIIKIDNLNNTYSIFLEDYIEKFNYRQNMNKQDINISKNEIESNSYNNKIKINATETYIISQYFSEYRRKMINDTENAYNLLNEEYRQEKYGSYEKFAEYVRDNIDDIEYASIDGYQITEYDNKKEYVCIDKNGKYYIFIENSITDYEVALDTYTIDLAEFSKKYNSSNDATKCGLNTQKILDAINDGDYSYVYKRLDSTFKQNNFPTEESFARYAENNLTSNQMEYNDYENSGELHIYNLTLTRDNNTVEKTIIMKLIDESDFVFSFNVE